MTLTLDSAVTNTDTGVKVSYTKPGSGSGNKIKGRSTGLEVPSFTNRAVNNFRNWTGVPTLFVEVNEGGTKTFQWTPPGTPTAQSPVMLILNRYYSDSAAPVPVTVLPYKRMFTSKTAGTFTVHGQPDDDWADEVVNYRVTALADGGGWRLGNVSITVKDDDKVAPGESGGCAAATGSPFWKACLRVGSGSGNSGFEGLSRAAPQFSFGGLSDTTVDGTTHVIDGIVKDKGLTVSFEADPRPAANSWVLKLGSKFFSFSDAQYYWEPRAGALRASRVRWRLAPAGAAGFEMNLDATRSEPAGGDAPPVHGVMIRGALRW